MNSAFKKWLIDDSKNWSPEQKKDILRMIKFEPEKMVQLISENLIDWATVYCLQAGRTIASYDSVIDAKELLTAYQGHFITELAAIGGQTQ